MITLLKSREFRSEDAPDITIGATQHGECGRQREREKSNPIKKSQKSDL